MPEEAQNIVPSININTLRPVSLLQLRPKRPEPKEYLFTIIRLFYLSFLFTRLFHRLPNVCHAIYYFCQCLGIIIITHRQSWIKHKTFHLSSSLGSTLGFTKSSRRISAASSDKERWAEHCLNTSRGRAWCAGCCERIAGSNVAKTRAKALSQRKN